MNSVYSTHPAKYSVLFARVLLLSIVLAIVAFVLRIVYSFPPLLTYVDDGVIVAALIIPFIFVVRRIYQHQYNFANPNTNLSSYSGKQMTTVLPSAFAIIGVNMSVIIDFGEDDTFGKQVPEESQPLTSVKSEEPPSYGSNNASQATNTFIA